MNNNLLLFLYSLLIGLPLTAAHAASQVAEPIPRPDHVVLLILENHGVGSVLGSTHAPYINGLAEDPDAALFTQSYALTHPSQPNYLMLFSGSRQGVLADYVPLFLPFKTPNLGAALLAKSLTFTGYSEDLPSVGFTGKDSNAYVRRHAPWVNWLESSENGLPPSVHQPFTAFPKNFNSLPTLSIVVPNLNHDMHDGTVDDGDAWIKANLSGYIEWAKTHNSLFILTFDEDEYLIGDNLIPTIFVGPMIKKGHYAGKIDHYDVLRTVEDMYGLTHSGDAAEANPITEVWNTSAGIAQRGSGFRSLGLSARASAHAMLFSFGPVRNLEASLEILAPDGRLLHRAQLKAGTESYAWAIGQTVERRCYVRLRDGEDEAAYFLTLP